jgi:TRAP-type C4-dicarboxylate transport system permease small subunit
MVSFLDKFSRLLNRTMIWIAGLFLSAMIVITCANIVSRIVWVPVKGTYELMGFFGAIVTAFALGYTQMHRGHICVDILVNRFPRRLQVWLNGINAVVGVLLFGIGGWQLIRWANTLRVTGEITETLRIIYYPFVFGVAFGCFLLALVLCVDFLRDLINPSGKGA